ncbi:MAG: hypothetical protein K2X86_05950 [Cytophagaceae bacterium]|nr:hypothetical protein [Cytophagaceae bacterium]
MEARKALAKNIKRYSPREKANCKRKFLRFFPKGFKDSTYHTWERDYKWDAHLAWEESLPRSEYKRLLLAEKYLEIANRAVRIETKTNLLFSFEKMALRDAVKSYEGAKAFAYGLFDYVYGSRPFKVRFNRFIEVLASLPRKQTRVLTWPLLTVFGFIADPSQHIFLKPRVTKIAAEKYGYDFHYKSKPDWETYQSYLNFAAAVASDLKDLKPRDMIDIQSFMWVQGSEEYDEIMP